MPADLYPDDPWPVRALDALVRLIARLGLPESFVRFGFVGVQGFCWDTGTVYALRAHISLYMAGACGFFVAATANWVLNRVWTFRHLDHGAPHIQWAKFILANAVGFVANRGTFFALITVSALAYQQPVLGILAGTCAGLVFNYVLSKKFVFR
ncbi:GtrA family protein [Acidocella sp.]|uniref:GtrA family protein n=1 Tax=Acidocella sp. TaxID=50710 RepID=UPI00260775B6|nr:GtrA family protein [Acidocella sp.]